MTGLLPAILAVVGGGLAGFWLGRLGRAASHREIALLTGDVSRSEAHSREQTRLLSRMRFEQATVSGVIRQLPDIVRDLNRSDLEPERIPALLFTLAQDIFQPEHILLYTVAAPGDEEAPNDELILQAHRGLGEVPSALRQIRIGEGRVGWAAENKVEMLSDDWLNQTRTEGKSIAENHPTTRLDMIGPLVHYGGKGAQLLGALCIGVAKSAGRPRDEKRMLQLITGLGSIALMNARYVKELQLKANHDGLTGLLNKRHFLLELGNLIHKAERENLPLSVFMFDIDHFKKYNDQNGHQDGDELLKTIARVLRKCVRPGDLVGRYGGEEFLLAMPDTDRDGALTAAQRVREAIESYPFAHGEKQPLGKLSISGGVAAFPADGTQGPDLIRNADQALYRAKAEGRNRVFAYRAVEFGESGDARPAVARVAAGAGAVEGEGEGEGGDVR